MHAARRLLTAFLVLLAPLSAGCGSDLGTPEGDVRTGVVFSGGRDREYVAFVPQGLDLSRPQPVVLALHGTPGSPSAFRGATGLDRLADGLGGLAVYPRSTSDWDEGCDCTNAESEGVDDLAFVRDLLDALDERWGIDRDAVYVVGFSQGALFAEYLTCSLTPAPAGLAVVAATMSAPLAESCEPAAPVPALFAKGTSDTAFPEEGGGTGALRTLAMEATLGFWRAVNGCDDVVDAEETADDGWRDYDVSVRRWAGCDDGAAVVHYRVEGGPHAWPSTFGEGVVEAVEDFFRDHGG